MNEHKDKLYLEHILAAIGAVDKFIKGIGYEDFMKNKLVQDGVIREIEIIGEAAKRLSDEFKSRYGGVPWKEICGMRDKLIHDYFVVDLDDVWKTAVDDLAELKIELAE